MPVSMTMRPIQPRQYCCSQCGSSPQVTQTKPGLLLRVCVYVFVCVHMFLRGVRHCGEKERAGRGGVENAAEFMRAGVKTAGESAAQGQEGVFCSQVHAEDSPIGRTNSFTDVHLFYQREWGRYRKKTFHISTPEHGDQSDSHHRCRWDWGRRLLLSMNLRALWCQTQFTPHIMFFTFTSHMHKSLCISRVCEWTKCMCESCECVLVHQQSYVKGMTWDVVCL